MFASFASADSPSSQAWTNYRPACEFAENRDKNRLHQDYNVRGFTFCLSHIRPSQQIEDYILLHSRMRFFLWSPIKGELQFIRTPWNLQGLHIALNSGENLKTQLMRKWNHNAPGVKDIMPCPPAPQDWLKEHSFLLATFECQDFRLWDLHNCKPMVFYNSRSGDDDADFFHSEGNFYLYLPFHGVLYEVPEIKDDPTKFAKLGTAPEYEGLQLNKLGPAEIFGGRRILDQAAIPSGWTQLPWNPDQQVPVLPPRCKWRNTSNVLTSDDAKSQIIESDDEYFMWFVPENRVSQVAAPLGLEEILRDLRLNSKCHFVRE
ncbi:MAG: hypothetical protein OHK93_008787 [Ramalina farinacea]|uniref:Uncharacterized protein n=1 Tax=Ramalina farinacea TaxID=258253 RepID=A0AA43QN44_9LECA|nr:hypothetical protein [Ramalina farinacea]